MKIPKLKQKSRIVFFSMLLILSIFSATSVKVQAKTNVKNYNRFMNICETTLKNMKKHHFRYSNNGYASTYKKAARGSHRTNCALYVSWCLQQYGAIDKGDTFYVSGSGRIHKNFRSFGKDVRVIKVYRRRSSVHLLPGDVVCWSSASHTNIYAGKSKSGKSLWYDGGKISTASNSNGSRYTNTKKLSLGYLNHRKISYIIRIKNINS